MSEQTTAAAPRRKTEQAIKCSASWTPGAIACTEVENAVLKIKALRIRGGRLTINAAIAIGDGKGDKVVRAYARAQELEAILANTGTVHSFTMSPGAVPVGEAEQLPEVAE